MHRPPSPLAMAQSVEYSGIAREVATITVDTSTHARCGITAHVTPFEPE